MSRAPAAFRVGTAALSVAVAAAALAVDPGAATPFDAPKRWLGFAGVAAAAAAYAALPNPFAAVPRGLARVALCLAAVAGLGVLASALASPRPELARSALPPLALSAVALALGASRPFGEARGAVAAAFVGAATIDAAVAVGERLTGVGLFAVEAVTERGAGGAFVGNQGQLGLLLAMTAVTAAAMTLRASRGRLAWSGALLVSVAGLLANAGLTAALAAGVGIGAIAVLCWRRRAVAPIAAALALAVAAGALTPGLRGRVAEIASHLRAGRWDDATSSRFGPWAAAVEMARERPLLGFGPGTFGAEFVPHRLAAEMRWRTRLASPVLASSYAAAHAELLQAVAEWGVVAGVAAAAAFLAVLAGVLQSAVARSDDVELLALAGVLASALVAALAWFPFQQASLQVPLLLAVGRAWRRCA